MAASNIPAAAITFFNFHKSCELLEFQKLLYLFQPKVLCKNESRVYK
jgi:hypothetical protein